MSDLIFEHIKDITTSADRLGLDSVETVVSCMTVLAHAAISTGASDKEILDSIAGQLQRVRAARMAGMPSEPRTIKGPCFDCNEQCWFGKSGCVKDHIITMCDCHCDDAEQTAPVPKLDPETRPNVPPRMM